MDTAVTSAANAPDKFYAPPKPAMALRVGVTGHRQSRLSKDQLARIETQIDEILDAVSDALRRTFNKYTEEYSETPPIRYFVSALADGADTLAANKALGAGWRLLAPLPFLKDIYEKDFAPQDRREFDALLNKAHAVAELDGERTSAVSEERAYLQAGLVTVSQSDFIIAIWDGEEARGVAGTAMIKEHALSSGKPVLWINAVSDKPPVFLSADNDHALFTPEAVYSAVDEVVAPPPCEEIEHEFSGKDTHAIVAYREFSRESAHKFNYGSFFQFWEKAFAGKWPFSVKLSSPGVEEAITQTRRSTLAEKVRASQKDQNVFNELIIPRFVWADHLAIHYGNLYRSSYFFNYLFAAVAVFLALVDLVARDYDVEAKTLLITIEVIIIVCILAVTIAGKRGRWHEKWIDYRQLAEELRQYRLLFLTLGPIDEGADFPSGEGGEAAGWVDWYFDATRREAGMTSSDFEPSVIKMIAQTVLDEEILPQIHYHDRKAGTLHVMEHRLHHFGEYAFGMTLVVCLSYLSLAFLAKTDMSISYWAEIVLKLIKSWVTMLTGFLPALGAAFFGIRVQGEFGSTAERSHATAAQLKAIAKKFEAIVATTSPPLGVLRNRMEEASRAMLMENMDWRLLYISKPLNLPG